MEKMEERYTRIKTQVTPEEEILNNKDNQDEISRKVKHEAKKEALEQKRKEQEETEHRTKAHEVWQASRLPASGGKGDSGVFH